MVELVCVNRLPTVIHMHMCARSVRSDDAGQENGAGRGIPLHIRLVLKTAENLGFSVVCSTLVSPYVCRSRVTEFGRRAIGSIPALRAYKCSLEATALLTNAKDYPVIIYLFGPTNVSYNDAWKSTASPLLLASSLTKPLHSKPLCDLRWPNGKVVCPLCEGGKPVYDA